jgi:acyl-CoA thioester hydrolase
MSRPTDESPDRFRVELPLKVQGYDIDVAGIVSNIVYVRWLEELRQAFCDAFYPIEEMLAQGFLPALTSTHIEYRRATRFGDRVAGQIRFEGFRGQRWHFAFEILTNGQTAALARQTGVLIHLADGKIRRVPDDMFERLGRLKYTTPGGWSRPGR